MMRVRRATCRRADVVLLTIPLLSGCGKNYVVLHPVGPVGLRELHLLTFASAAMAFVAVALFILFAVTLVRYRDRSTRRHPYQPDWTPVRSLEILMYVAPVILLTAIAIPTVSATYALTQLPQNQKPLVVDVTSLTWKWMFQYPAQQVATVNYLEIPTGRPVLFELTANSAMNTFWVPQLGGMEYAMPGRIIPLWLEANRAGTYWGHSGQFSGTGFAKMFFTVHAVPAQKFTSWTKTVEKTRPPMTLADYHRLLHFGNTGFHEYSAYPRSTFPAVNHNFSLNGGMYQVWSNQPGQ